MAQNGLTHVQIANALKINPRSFERYLVNEADLKEAMNCGRQVAIKEVENAIYDSAIGIRTTVTKAMKLKKVIYQDGKKIQEVETVTPYQEEVFVPPNVQAAIFLLKNWKKEDYSSEPAMLELKKKELELKQNGRNNAEDNPIEWAFENIKSVS